MNKGARNPQGALVHFATQSDGFGAGQRIFPNFVELIAFLPTLEDWHALCTSASCVAQWTVEKAAMQPITQTSCESQSVGA